MFDKATMPPSVALYARVSTTDQRCDLQLNEMREYVERRGWRLHSEYVDTGWSGAKRDRPQLEKLMNAARKHMFDIVLVWKVDRFGRSVSNFVEHMQVLKAADVRFICVAQSIDTDAQNPGSKLLMDIMIAFAEFERSMTRERVKAGLKAAVKRGSVLGRKPKVFDRDKVRQLHLQGKTQRQIVAIMGISKGTVNSLLPKAPKPNQAA